MRSLTRRGILRQTAAALSVAAASPRATARAACPSLSGPLRWIVPNAPGGGYDELSRLFEPHIEEALGVRVQIDNVPGAGGLRGATLLSEAGPNQGMLGILNLPGLLMTAVQDDAALDPVERFTLLGTMGRSRHIWSTGASTNIQSLDDLLRIGRTRGLVFAMQSFNSQGFFNAAIPCGLLGLRAEFVTGYGGSRESIMATIRGEVDLVSLDSGTQADIVGAGDLRPILSISSRHSGLSDAFRGLPTLTGPDGLAQSHGSSAVATAESLVRFSAAGRVIAASPGLEPALARCLEQRVCEALQDPAFKERAAAKGWALETACAAETLEHSRLARSDARRLAPIVREAVAQARA